jgi:hypothetical protein
MPAIVEARCADLHHAVEDGDGGGAVPHEHHVGVSGVDGKGEADVQRRRGQKWKVDSVMEMRSKVASTPARPPRLLCRHVLHR